MTIPSRTIKSALAVALALGAGRAAAQHYGIRDLGTLGGPTSEAFGINHFGRIVGAGTLPSADLRGYVTAGNALIELDPQPGDGQTYAFAIDDDGRVAAQSFDMGDLTTRGILWDAGGALSLGNLAPRSLNNAGTVVGAIALYDASFGWVDHAARWENGALLDLGTLGGHFSYAAAVSGSGQIVGMSFLSDDWTRRAALWNGSWHDLGTLGGANSHAYDINDFNEVVGVADTSDGQPHAFRFTVNAAGGVVDRRDLGTLGGGYSYGLGVNNLGQVVGTSASRAFLYHNNVMSDLNAQLPPGADWRLDVAWSVNDHGQIVGSGLHHGQPRAFVMSPFDAGDLNCDGSLNGYDIEGFVAALLDWSAYAARFPACNVMNADLNGDGSVNGLDIHPFVELLMP